MSYEGTVMGPSEPREADKVYAGQTITTEMATRAILGLIHSPVTGTMAKRTTRSLVKDLGPQGTIYPLLSKGEKNLVKLALEIWDGASPLGGIDKDSRRKVLIIMWYFYLGEVDFQYASETTFLTQLDFHRMFPKEPDKPGPSAPV
jgi:hypothetical protein